MTWNQTALSPAIKNVSLYDDDDHELFWSCLPLVLFAFGPATAAELQLTFRKQIYSLFGSRERKIVIRFLVSLAQSLPTVYSWPNLFRDCASKSFENKKIEYIKGRPDVFTCQVITIRNKFGGRDMTKKLLVIKYIKGANKKSCRGHVHQQVCLICCSSYILRKFGYDAIRKYVANFTEFVSLIYWGVHICNGGLYQQIRTENGKKKKTNGKVKATRANRKSLSTKVVVFNSC